jgi:hypothetical protein
MRRLGQTITWLHVTLSAWPTPSGEPRGPGGRLLGMRRPAGWRGAATITAAAVVIAAAVVGMLVAREHGPRAGGQARRPPAAQAAAPPEAPPRWSVGGVAPPLVTPWERGPLAAGDLVLVPTGFQVTGRVRAYEARTGRLRWAYRTRGTAFVWAVGEGRAIVAPDRGSLVALDLETGRQRWHLALSPGQSPEHGTIAGGRLYVGTSFTSEGDLRPPIVYAVDLATGRRRWRAVLEPGTDLQWGAPVVEGASSWSPTRRPTWAAPRPPTCTRCTPTPGGSAGRPPSARASRGSTPSGRW